MQHQESSIKVYYTQEYKRFKMINGNRQLNATKVKKIQKDINEGLDVLRYCPILVSEKDNRLEIIDGQHLFFVARQMKSKVWYILIQDMSIMDIAKINSNTEKWKHADFINAFVQMGNKDYQLLDNFMDQFQIPRSVAIKLLRSGRVGGEGGDYDTKAFQRGEFKVKAKKEAIEFMELAKRFDISEAWNKRGFLVALDKIKESNICDIEELIEKVNSHPERLIKSGSFKEFLSCLEDIYNIRNRQRRVIY